MKRFSMFLLFFSFISSTLSYAAENPPQTLQENLVTVENGKFFINKYLSCSLSLPPSLGGGTPFNTFSMHVRFQAPAEGLISRDIFVALSMRLFTEARIRLAAEIPGLSTEQTLRAMQCHEVSQQSTNIHYTYSVKMSSQGVASEINDKQLGVVHIDHKSWKDILQNLPEN